MMEELGHAIGEMIYSLIGRTGWKGTIAFFLVAAIGIGSYIWYKSS